VLFSFRQLIIKPMRNPAISVPPFRRRKGRGTPPPPNPQRTDQCVFKYPGSITESYDCMIDLLLVLNLERVGRQDHLNVICDFMP